MGTFVYLSHHSLCCKLTLETVAGNWISCRPMAYREYCMPQFEWSGVIEQRLFVERQFYNNLVFLSNFGSQFRHCISLSTKDFYQNSKQEIVHKAQGQ